MDIPKSNPNEIGKAAFLAKLLAVDDLRLSRVTLPCFPPWAQDMVRAERTRRSSAGFEATSIVESLQVGNSTGVGSEDGQQGASSINEFSEMLRAMDRLTLNHLNMMDYDRSERRLIEEERVFRKTQRQVQAEAAKKQKNKKKGKNQRRGLKGEYDGEYLHEHFVNAVGADGSKYELVYDHDLQDGQPMVHYGDRENFARFFCYTCPPTRGQRKQQTNTGSGLSSKRIPRVWVSGVVFTEYWITTDNNKNTQGRTRLGTRSLASSTLSQVTDADPSSSFFSVTRYRILIHAQKCQVCDRYCKPKVKTSKFVRKTLSSFDLWTNKRDRVQDETDDKRKLTQPHDYDRCHGCLSGKCRERDEMRARSRG
ncbi:hypothetical protein BGZ83_004683 [Gryganskiella cystojenkinii]|nr:hypothetical protein BGZ83_004683 [Gryganskiella cystojenkinii]